MLAANISERRGGCLMKHTLSGKKPSSQSYMGFFDTVQLRILLSYTGCFQKVKEPLSFCTRRSFTIKYRIDVVKALALPNGNCSKFATKLRLTAQQKVESRPGILDEKGDSNPDDGWLGGRKVSRITLFDGAESTAFDGLLISASRLL